jgi:hypothetical protein
MTRVKLPWSDTLLFAASMVICGVEATSAPHG